MLPVLAALAILTVALAGCSSKGGNDDPTNSNSPSGTGTGTGTRTASGTGTGTSTGTGTGSPTANRAPTGSFAASVPNGTIPLAVNFTVTGTDLDGDSLSWVLAFGDNATSMTGASVPATVEHNYTTAGLFNATLNLTDGTAFVVYTVTLNVTTATLAGQAIDLSYMVASYGCGEPPLKVPAWDSPFNGLVWAEFVVDAATIGLDLKVTGDSSNPVATLLVMAFYTAAGDPVGSTLSGDRGFTGTVPTGAVYGLLTDCGGVGEVNAHYASGSQIVV